MLYTKKQKDQRGRGKNEERTMLKENEEITIEAGFDDIVTIAHLIEKTLTFPETLPSRKRVLLYCRWAPNELFQAF